MVPLVSILIPAFNAVRYLTATIQSALNQTWPNCEIIIVDDGSSDDTFALAKSFESPTLKVFRQANAGPCVARNKAFSLCQGEFVQWLDADDLLAPTKIAEQMAVAQAYGDGRVLLSCPFGFFYQWKQAARFRPTSLWQDLDPVEWIVRSFSDNAYIAVHAWLTNRSLTEAAGPWDARLWKTSEDGEYSTRMVAKSKKVVFVPTAKCYYRKGIPGSLSATRHHVDLEKLLHGFLVDHLLEREDSPATRSACCRLIQTWADSPACETPDARHAAQDLASSHGFLLTTPRGNKKYDVCNALLGRESTDRIRSLVRSLRLRLAISREHLRSVLIETIDRLPRFGRSNRTGAVSSSVWRRR